MRGDFSQLALDAGVYSQVLMQQGRVLVDADWNAAGTALLTAQRALAADLIGPHGGPATDLGFSIAGTTSDFEIGPGVYYVDGIRCALAPDAAGPDGAVRWSRQPYPPFGDTPTLPDPPRLAYLDLWERHVTCLQDDTIREVALGGPDTTSRVQVVWQVRVMSIAGDAGGAFRTSGTDFPLEAWRSQLAGQPPQLRVWAREPADRDDTPCLAGPDARYRGAENCLYRVEIASAGPPTFVWSRENGSVVAGWNETDGADLRVTGVRDTARGFTAGDWVELTWDTLELAGQAGTRARVAQVDGTVITLDPATATGPVVSPVTPVMLLHAQVRRWDQRERTDHPLTGGAVPVIEASADDHRQPLEAGIDVQFVAPPQGGATHTYRVGDYWTFPARVETGDVTWPRTAEGSPLAVPAHGVQHHYAPLAWQTDDGAGWTDLRRQFTPLATAATGPPTPGRGPDRGRAPRR